MNTSVRIVICIAFLTTIAPAQELITDSCFAPSLGRLVHVNVIVPKSFDRATPHPALILLHGYGGNRTNWGTQTRLREYVRDMPLVILMPDGENSWYVNSRTQPANRFEDFLTDDLSRFAAARYGVDTNRLAVGGLSMGGYGALNAGLRHPDRFRMIIALSASLDIPNGIPDLVRNGRGGMRPSLIATFGEDSSAFWKAHDPFTLFRQPMDSSKPYVYLANGIQDGFAKRLGLYRAFADSLRAAGWRYEYHETPGRHDMEYWDREIGPALVRLREILKF